MDVEFEYRGTTFVANALKARQNPLKHDGITFQMAAEALFDHDLVYIDASRNGEDRAAVIGFDSKLRLLYVVHIEIENEYIRLISARKATLKEVKKYDIG